METDQAPVGFEQIARILRRRMLWIVLSFVVVTGSAYAYSKHQPKKYTASAAVSFSNDPLSEQLAGLTPVSSSNPVAQQNHNLELVRLGNAATATARLLGDNLTGAKVAASLSTSLQGESGIVTISATSTSPTIAAAIANTYSSQFSREQRRSNRRFYLSALAQVKRQLDTLTPAQRVGADGAALEDRVQTLELLSTLGYNDARVAQEAIIPSSPSSPKTARNTLLGALLGLAVGIALAFLFERLDHRIREPEELEAVYGLPMLGEVPKSNALARAKNGDVRALPTTEAEAFSLIRAHLRFFNLDRDVRTVLLASPALADGKTTVARRLVEAAARSGGRALLLETDLRRPALAAQLGLRSGPGLTEVLIGTATLGEAIQSVDLQTPGPRPEAHTLNVLAAGAALPPNPSELLENRVMDTLLVQLRATYDLVVIDTPPLTLVSDAFPLLSKVDGVVIVGRIGYSRRDAAEALQKILAGAEAPLLGVIANGYSSGVLKPYGQTTNVKAAPAPSAAIANSSEELVSSPPH
jgi:polysaccharide biosynthesis transport protein